MTTQSYKAQQAANYDGYEDAPRAQNLKPLTSDGKSASAFRTISEVAEQLDVQQHVLRFWETKFSQVKPLKRGGGRRYYRPEDVELLKSIHHLLYTQGYTIKGVQKLFREQGKNKIRDARPAEEQTQGEPDSALVEQAVLTGENLSGQQREVLKEMLAELKALRSMIGDRT